MDFEFFTGWFYRLSPGDTFAFFVVLGFIVIMYVRYVLPANHRFKRKKRKAAKQAEKQKAKDAKAEGASAVTKAAPDSATPSPTSSQTGKVAENKIEIPKDL